MAVSITSFVMTPGKPTKEVVSPGDVTEQVLTFRSREELDRVLSIHNGKWVDRCPGDDRSIDPLECLNIYNMGF